MSSSVSCSRFPVWIVVGWMTIFLVGTDLFVVSPFLPLIGADIHRSAESLTVLVSVFSLVYALACPVQGWIAERFGPQSVLVFGVCALSLANAYTALSPDFAHLVASRAAAGLAAASISPMIHTLTAHSAEPARRGSSLAIVNSGLIISLVLGAPVGLLFADLTEWRWVFGALAVLLAMMIPANVMIWTRPNAGSRPQADPPRDERLVGAWPLIAGMTAWAASVYMTYTLLGTTLSTKLHLSAWAASLVLSVFGIGATAGVLLGGRLADRIGAPRVVRMAFIAMAAAFCVSAAAFGSGLVALFALALFIVGLSAYGFFPAIQAVAAGTFTAKRPTVLGLMSSALYVGITLGSFVGGVVFERFGMLPVLIASALTALVGLALTVTLS